ncbi:hypothetical protein OPS25_05105 [Alteromonas ponticola]|uniref:Uncharacterized protein n=1 Tax=Alteromonas aquimaris TaxID=2998417 RepID=A0ABT3P530_9ALTE|nr:hypothetical protein [Alteromonas aquimaris]MCW8107875.1 hypothetical protein [Alteromonas aquimaris]
MFNKNMLLIGQVLQIRDKIFAKRHCIPSSLKKEWTGLLEMTSSFDASNTVNQAVKGRQTTKPETYKGNSVDLAQLVASFKKFESKISRNRSAH